MRPSAPLTMTIQTMTVAEDGAALRAIDPDASGMYRGVPLAVLGGPNRHGTLYDAQRAQAAMTDPKSRFYLNVKEANQEGEYGHPFATAKDLRRTTYIDRTRVSHFINNIDFEKLERGMVLVRGDIGASGPFGSALAENFANPNRNAAFSLRALTRPIGNNAQRREIVAMVTFDAVDGPGFEQCCKRYMASTEGMEISVTDVLDLEDKSGLFATEDITDQQILDIFQTSLVTVCHSMSGILDADRGVLIDPSNPHRVRSATHAALRSL